jgi:hypothetical protein
MQPYVPIGLTLPQYVSFCGCTSGSPYTSEVEVSSMRAFEDGGWGVLDGLHNQNINVYIDIDLITTIAIERTHKTK